jgi:dTDP-glucose 4,6-dehydratase
MKEVNTVVHFAAESHVDRSIENSFDFVDTNVKGTAVLLDAALKHNVSRFHHVSTDEVYGDLPLDDPEAKFSESTPYNPSSPYSAAKAGSDLLVKAYARTHKLPVTISNCSNNYGPYQFPEKLIPLVITRAMNDEEIPVYGDGRQVRDWIHVNDHNRGIELILEKGKIGETYVLGGNGEKENIWIAKKILEILGKPEDLIVHVGDRKGHDVRYAIDYSKAKKELGFQPSKSIDKWLEKTVKWYQKNEDIWKPLKPQADVIAERYLSKRI